MTVEAQTARFKEQMGKARKTASEAGDAIAGTDFRAVGNQLQATFAAVPAKLAAAMAPIAGKIESSLTRGFRPLEKVRATIGKLGGSLVHAFRFDLIAQGLATARVAVDALFKHSTGGAAALGLSLKAALSFGSLVNGLRHLQHQIALMISPSRLLARAILASTAAGLSAARSATQAFFSGATGGAARLGGAIQRALSFGIAISRSKAVVGQLAKMINISGRLGGAIRAVGSGIARIAHGAATLTSRLTGAQKAAGGLKSTLAQIAVAAGFAAVGYKIVEFFKDAVQGASHYRETIDKINAVMGDAAPAAISYANEMAEAFGLVKTSTLDATSAFAGLSKGLGKLKGKELSDLSIKMTQLATDFTSFGDIDFDEAQKSIRIGMTGEPSDVLKQFGVVVLDATTKQYALNNGMKLVNGKLTEQQKLLARVGVITKGLADADGNLEDTQNSTANLTRKAAGQWENLATTIGLSLLPFVDKAIKMFSEFTVALTKSFEKNKGAVEGFMNKMIVGLDIIKTALLNWDKSWKLIVSIAQDAWADVVAMTDIARGNLGIIATWIGGCFRKLFSEIGRMADVAFSNIGENIKNAVGVWAHNITNPLNPIEFKWTGMLDGFQVALDKMPPLMGVAMKGMSQKTKDLWKDLSKDVNFNPKVDINGPIKKGQAVDLPDKKEGDKGKVSDIQSFAQSLQEAVSGRNQAAEKTAKATRDAVKELQKLNETIKAKNFGGGAAGPEWQMAGIA